MSAAPLLSMSRQRDRATGTPGTGAASAGFCAALGCLISQHAVAPAHSLLPKSEQAPTKVCSPPVRSDTVGCRTGASGSARGELDACRRRRPRAEAGAVSVCGDW